MEEGVVAPFVRIGVEEELGGGVPEDFVGRELEEDFCVGCHVEIFDALALPGWQGGGEPDSIVLEDAEGECADGIVGVDTGAVLVEDRHAMVAVRNVRDDGV